MDIRVEQQCHQCGGELIVTESDRLIGCSYCGVKSFLQSSGPFRYLLPARVEPPSETVFMYAPYVRFKGTIFTVTEKGIQHQVIDTTQVGCALEGLPPSLGVRPQAMVLQRLTSIIPGEYLQRTMKPAKILAKAINITSLTAKAGKALYHRAYIGESLSFIYLPVCRDKDVLVDGVTDLVLSERKTVETPFPATSRFNPSWQISFKPTLCGQCGWTLDGEKECLVMTCSNCHSAWELSNRGLVNVAWQQVEGDKHTALYVPFWKITATVPHLAITSYADFIERTNQPLLPRSEWRHRPMEFWVPAFKLRPKIFLIAGKQATANQWKLNSAPARHHQHLFPATLPSSEALQALKVILATSATSPRNIFPNLPQVQFEVGSIQLVHLPFVDKGHDWQQPESGVTIGKNILRFGRSM